MVFLHLSRAATASVVDERWRGDKRGAAWELAARCQDAKRLARLVKRQQIQPFPAAC
jgi:hypothetical protein